jgi:hypothetical protein
MGMRENNEEGLSWLGGSLRDVRDQLLMFYGAEHAMIESDENLPRVRR